jgi:prepilin peptidase CpaA
MHAFFLLAVVASAIAAVYDMRTREIPNWVSLGTLAVAIIAHLVIGTVRGGVVVGAQEGGWSVIGAFVCGLVPFLFFWRVGSEGFGGGDVKMMAAVGALLSWPPPAPLFVGIEAELYAFISAAVLAPAFLAWEGKLFSTLANVANLLLNPFRPKAKKKAVPVEAMTSLRFAPAIFAGALLCAAFHWREAP